MNSLLNLTLVRVCGESVFGLNYNNSLSLWNFDEYFLKCRVWTSGPSSCFPRGLQVPRSSLASSHEVAALFKLTTAAITASIAHEVTQPIGATFTEKR